jgi:hypothetical protein
MRKYACGACRRKFATPERLREHEDYMWMSPTHWPHDVIKMRIYHAEKVTEVLSLREGASDD